MRLTAHGVSATLPPGWEGAISREPDAGIVAQQRVPGRVFPTLHLSNFPLPRQRGDYGGGVVDRMTARDAFLAVVEFSAESAGTPLFRGPMPRLLHPGVFSPRTLHRTLAGQAGYQAFFTEAARAFCLYVVLGGDRDVHVLVRDVNDVLAGLRIDPS